MKKLIIAVLLMTGTFMVRAQDVNVGGKTYYYYDEVTKKKVKEIFHFVEIIKIIPDPDNYGTYTDTTLRVKHGPYLLYYENGALWKSGYYRDGELDSVWIYYNEAGKELKRELYRQGKLFVKK